MNHIIGQESNLKILRTAIMQDLPVLLIGETGTGKTEMAKMLAQESDQTLVRYSINGETTIDEIIGRYELINGATVWQDGIVIQAMKNGHWLLMDEVNLALPEVIMVLQALLDDSKEIRVAQHHGEIVKPATGFRYIATMNPSDGYAGTKPLNRAFLSRHPIVINVEYPERGAELTVLKSHGLKEEEAQTILDIALTTRDMKKRGLMDYQISTRELIQYATLRQCNIAPEEAVELAITNKAQNEDRIAIKTIVEDITADYKSVKEEFGFIPTIKHLRDEQKKIELTKKELELQRAQIKEEVARELIGSIQGESKQEAPF